MSKPIVGPEALKGALLHAERPQTCWREYTVLHLADGTAHIISSDPYEPHILPAIPADMSLPTQLRLGLVTQAEHDARLGDEPQRLARHTVELRQIELEGAQFQLEQAREALARLEAPQVLEVAE